MKLSSYKGVRAIPHRKTAGNPSSMQGWLQEDSISVEFFKKNGWLPVLRADGDLLRLKSEDDSPDLDGWLFRESDVTLILPQKKRTEL